MRWLLLVMVVACKSSPSDAPAHKPNDEMDEKMRHCPLALDGAAATLDNVAGGVRFTVHVPPAQLDELRKRAHHIVEFAARRTREGHGEFDAKGGGHMKNCPVLTEGVTIAVTDLPDGAQLDVTGDRADAIRAESRDRARKFPFVGATITVR